MKFLVPICAAFACLAVLLAGCNQHANSAFNSPAGIPPGAAAVAPPAPGLVAPQSAAPYVLSAQSAGPYINFSIYNMGTTDLTVKTGDFALIDPGSRDVIPYDKSNAIIDLPQPATIKPNDTLQGRAIFHKVASPVGKRLVFKPDNVGTFADINRMSSLNSAAPQGPVGPAMQSAPGVAGNVAAPVGAPGAPHSNTAASAPSMGTGATI